MPKRFRSELRENAIRMVLEHQAIQGGPRSHSTRVIIPQVGVGKYPPHMWCNRHGHAVAPGSAGANPADEIRRIKREMAEALQENEIPEATSAFFAAELNCPTTR
ncbi:hypothetical protein [Micrococcus luteus]|uniref:hypothetical protein n=1 Tax=Micrococcus luteus TaxID=1270 RepID=UPI003EBCF780